MSVNQERNKQNKLEKPEKKPLGNQKQKLENQKKTRKTQNKTGKPETNVSSI